MNCKRVLILAAALVIAVAGSANAASFGPFDGSIPWTGGSTPTIEDLLATHYFGDDGASNYTEIFDFDFQGKYNYTAIAHESSHQNIVSDNSSGAYNQTFETGGWANNDSVEVVGDYSNWGQWEMVDFDAGQNIEFKDNNDLANPTVTLDPFDNTKYANLRVFRLNNDSKPLDFESRPLPAQEMDPITLTAGTLIVGWNDNFDGDDFVNEDYDDIILAMKPVPEPGTVLLLGFGLAGLGFAGRRRMKK